ncbi:MAG: DUF3140 domain-containing protein [Rudanella sp.]|nr:DUF3140 domain-containing protein [Rudanella sp.]
MATSTTDKAELKEVKEAFKNLVNMSATQIEKWLDSDESNAVGQKKEDDDESTGHKSGKRIIQLLNKKDSDLTGSDCDHMRKVISYIKRHSAQRPSETEGSNWEYSLKNWGHDPNKK